MYLLDYVYCMGDIKINAFFPDIVKLIIDIIRIGVPVVLIILGMLDMFKAVTAQKEDEIKKAQGLFFKRLFAGVLVYLVFVIVELLIGILSSFSGTGLEDPDQNVWNCAQCFLEGSKSDNCAKAPTA